MVGEGNLPFDRGTTWYTSNLSSPSLTDGSATLEGKEYLVDDPNYQGGLIRLRVVRNTSAVALAAKRLVTFQTLFWGRRVDGYARVNPVFCRPVDDRYTTTIAVNDLFYIVMEGHCLVNTGLAADSTNVINEGDTLVNGTAVTSGATTAGRAVVVDLTGATTPLANQIINAFGRALTARTTGNTATDTLVRVGRTW